MVVEKIFRRFLSCFLLSVPACLGLIAQDQRPPNVIVVMADDHGKWASSVYGNVHVNTPHMDWLGQHGAIFDGAYAVSPVCSPSRASFFTGRMPSQHGVHDFLSETPEYEYHWLKDEILLSTLLKKAGYQTALIGKWHATSNSAQVQPGFDYWYSYDVGPAGWQNQYQHAGKVYFSEQGTGVTTEGFQTEVLTDKALGFIDDNRQRPFFLFLGFVDTHAPFEGQPQRLVDSLLKKNLESDIDDHPSPLAPRHANNLIPSNHFQQLAQYLAGVEFMDIQIGRVIAQLDANGILDNTLIIYTSDHGHMNGHHGIYGKGNATRPQNFYEESISVPLTLTWPAGIKPGYRYDEPVGTCDLFQTILDVAMINLDGAVARSINSPGASILRLLNDPEQRWTSYKYCEMGNARMIANEQLKYIQRLEPLVNGNKGELYDLKKDANETQNRIADPTYYQELQLLKTELEQFFNEYEEVEHSGNNLANQPPANGNEQWRAR